MRRKRSDSLRGADYDSSMLTLDHSPVHSDPKILGGTLVFKGTRVPAQTLFDYLDGDSCILEREPLERLSAEGQLMAYRHEGFFFAMDTYREYLHLNELWQSGKAPWKVWA